MFASKWATIFSLGSRKLVVQSNKCWFLFPRTKKKKSEVFTMDARKKSLYLLTTPGKIQSELKTTPRTLGIIVLTDFKLPSLLLSGSINKKNNKNVTNKFRQSKLQRLVFLERKHHLRWKNIVPLHRMLPLTVNCMPLPSQALYQPTEVLALFIKDL